MPIVTLSREYGAGGLRIGRRVAELLAVDLVDAVLVEEVARRLQISPEAVSRWDERREGVVLRLLRAMRAAHPEYATGSLLPEAAEAVADPEIVGRVTREVIEEQARTGSGVIVGRAAAFILTEHPDAHHFRIVAPREFRVENLVASGLARDEAVRNIDRFDRERVAYVRHHFGADVEAPAHYALVLNSARLGFERAARLIAGIAAAGPSGGGSV
jgi:cytidylate kinase